MHRRSLIWTSLALVGLVLSARPVTAAEAYAIVDIKTGNVFEAKEQKAKRQIGSLTKIATACVVLDWAEHRGGDMNEMVAIPPAALVGMHENNIGFQPGDEMTVRDLMYAALVQSDNIAAFTLAAHVGGKIGGLTPATQGKAKLGPVDTFVAQMNALAVQLKMERTRFVNPHGIDEKVKPLPYSTAEDMARLTRYAMNKAAFRFYVSQKERQISLQHGGKPRGYLLKNTNELVGQNGIDGVKTGRTARAGDCVILSAARDPEVEHTAQGTAVYDRRIIVVLLGSTNRFNEGLALINHGWQLYDAWAAAGRKVDPQKVLQ